MSDIEVIPVGTKVELFGGTKAVVVGILVRNGDRVLYDCGYWSGSSYQTGWFEEFMVSVEVERKTKIGYLKSNSKPTSPPSFNPNVPF